MSDLFYVKTRYDRPFNEMIIEEDTSLPILLSGFGDMNLPDENILYRLLWIKTVEGEWYEYGEAHSYKFSVVFPEDGIVNWIQVYESNEDSFLPHCYSMNIHK